MFSIIEDRLSKNDFNQTGTVFNFNGSLEVGQYLYPPSYALDINGTASFDNFADSSNNAGDNGNILINSNNNLLWGYNQQIDTVNLFPENSIDSFSINNDTSSKWSGGVLAPNGKIYGIPYNSSSVLIIDTNSPTTTPSITAGNCSYNNTTKTFTCSSGGFTSQFSIGDNIILTTSTGPPYTRIGYVQSIINNNTLLFFYALGSDLVLGTITSVQKTRKVDVTSIIGMNELSKWNSAVVAPNGKIYCVPHTSTSVLIIDPNSPTTTPSITAGNCSYNNTTKTFTCSSGGFTSQFSIGDNILLTTNTGVPYTGYVNSITNDTTLVFIYPLGSDLNLGSITSVQKTRKADITTIIYDTSYITNGGWWGGVLGNDGKIYCMPYWSSKILVINPLTNDFEMILGLDTITGTQWIGGVLGPNGKIYGIPHTATSVLIIDTNSPRTTPSITAGNCSYNNTTKTFTCSSGGFTSQFSIGDNIMLTTNTGVPYTGYVNSITNDTTLIFVYALGSDLGLGTITSVEKTRKVDVTSITGFGPVPRYNYKFATGALGIDGKIYGMPYFYSGPIKETGSAQWNSVLILDPNSPTTTPSITAGNCIYTDSSQTFTCSSGGFTSQFSIGDNILLTTSTGVPYTGYVNSITNDTTLVFIYPLGSDLGLGTITSVQKTRKADITTIEGFANNVTKWYGGVLSQNGKIYGIPQASTSVLILDTNSQITTVSITAGNCSYNNSSPYTFTCSSGGFTGSFLIGDAIILKTNTGIQYTGYVNSITNDTTLTFVYPLGKTIGIGTITSVQKTRKADITTISGLLSGNKWSGGVLGYDKKIYAIPRNSLSIGIIKTGLPTQEQWMLAPEFNKF